MTKPIADLSAPPAQPNQSLADGMTVLLQLVSAGRPMGSRELARDLGYEATRVNRLLGTLAHLGLAQRTIDRKYVAGPGIHVMAALSLGGSRLLPVALPHLERLQQETGLGVALGVLWRRQVCYLFHGGPGQSLSRGIAGHELYAAEQSSIGLALLAQESAERIEAIFAGATVNLGKLRRLLAAAREAGFADNEDHSIAVPVGIPAVAGIALVGVTADRRAEWATLLQKAATAIAVELAVD